MPKKIGAIGSDDDRKDIDIALQMANNQNYQQKLEQKEAKQKEIKAMESQQMQLQQQQQEQAQLRTEQQELKNIKLATPENARGSIYDENALNTKPNAIHNDNIINIPNDEAATQMQAKLEYNKGSMKNIDENFNKTSELVGITGHSVGQAREISDTMTRKIDEQRDIVAQIKAQINSTLAMADTTRVHQTNNQNQLNSQMENSTQKLKPDANLRGNLADNNKTDEKNNEEEKFREYKT